MALPPYLYKSKYHLSETILNRQVNSQGVETFRGSGTDYSEKSDDIIYFMSYPLERMIAFKAFIENISYNVSKGVEKKQEQDKQDVVVAFGEGEMDIDLTFNMPAHSVNESVNNIAKIEELQRLISPTWGYRDPQGLINTRNVVAPMFFIRFKNLISSGNHYTSYVKPVDINVENMTTNGFPCMIDSVVYEPDVEAGFFEFDNYRYPRNIKLNLKLTLVQEETISKEYVIDGFRQNGEYSFGDRGFFPFCVKVGDETDKTPRSLGSQTFEYSTETLNNLSLSPQNGDGGIGEKQIDEYFFFSLDTLEPSKWVVLKSFLNSFSRTNTMNNRFSSTKNRVGQILESDESVTFNDHTYKFSLTLPAATVSEAKKNCGKVQYLMRMFYRPISNTLSVYDFKELNNDANIPNRSLVTKKIKVYSPSFIEGPNSTTTSPFDVQAMMANAIDLHFVSLSVNVGSEMGYFEENGRLFPKEITLDFEFFYNSGELIKSYRIEGESYYMLDSKQIPGREERFPYDRQTVKIGGR